MFHIRLFYDATASTVDDDEKGISTEENWAHFAQAFEEGACYDVYFINKRGWVENYEEVGDAKDNLEERLDFIGVMEELREVFFESQRADEEATAQPPRSKKAKTGTQGREVRRRAKEVIAEVKAVWQFHGAAV